jgi:hypothetical protein
VFEPLAHDKKRIALVGKPGYATWYGNVDDTAVNVPSPGMPSKIPRGAQSLKLGVWLPFPEIPLPESVVVEAKQTLS